MQLLDFILSLLQLELEIFFEELSSALRSVSFCAERLPVCANFTLHNCLSMSTFEWILG